MKKELISTLSIRLLALVFTLMFTNCLYGQLFLSSYSNQSEIKDKISVTLTDGFHIPSGKTVRIFTAASFQECVPFLGTPSADQNYVSTRIFKMPGVNALNIDSARNTCEVNQTIQYFDGLGRPLQTIQVQGSPGFRDVVQPIAYDAFGREQYKYLPYTSALSISNGSFKSNAIADQTSFYTTPSTHAAVGVIPIPGAAFAETRFEPSPLNRVLEQGAPGAVGQLSAGHTQRIDYGTNILGEVKLWAVTTDGADGTGVYQPGRLYKTISKDENWTDAAGKAGITEEFKDLEGRVVLKRIWETDIKGLSTYYVYDDLGNLRYVLPPAVNENGQNPVNSFTEADQVFLQFIYGYHYDGRKRLVEKKIPGKGWEHLVYNKLDQLVLSQDALQRANGKWLFTKYDALGRVVVTGLYADTSSRTVLVGTLNNQNILWESRVATGTGYDNQSFPQTIAYYHTINYYDDYDFPGNTFPQPDGITQMQAARVKGLQTGGFVYLTESSIKFLSVNYYDKEGRVTRIASENHLGGTDFTDNSWNFAGELTASTRTHTASPTSPATTIATRYDYDHMGRKLATMESINGQAEVVLSKLTYNEIGQLLKKQLHSTDGNTFLQSTDYAYNERGWLKSGISDQFSLRLKYDDGTVPQYNGNIANQEWGTGVNFPNVFTYDYDKLNRLLKGATADIAMSEELSYDEMGNIKTLNRGGAGISSYSYTGNQLINVIGGSVTTGSYIHDINGNVTTDGRTGAVLSYNHLNLPISATRPDLSIAYTYDAIGNKLKKVSSNEATSDYVSGIQYTGGTIDFIMTEEGKARNNGGAYSYEYNLNDHLGNARYTFNQQPGVFELQKLQENIYYAFGKPVGGVALNKYLYNGKELQEELGQFDYGARFYDPVIGRWNVPDPLAELAPDLTPFRYCFNNPVNYIDPFGLWETTAGGYKTDKKEDIERFMDYLSIEKNSNKSNPSFSQMSTFIDGEMKTGGLGTLSDGSKLAKGFSISGQKDFYGGNNWVTDKKSYNDFWHSVEGDRNPGLLDPRSIGNNILGLTYAGSNNPKTYGGKDDYSYMPKHIEDFPAYFHDKDYDAKGIAGKNGLLSDPRGISADLRFAVREMAIAGNPNNSMISRARALILGAGVGFPGLYKLSKEGLQGVIQPFKVAMTPPSFIR